MRQTTPKHHPALAPSATEWSGLLDRLEFILLLTSLAAVVLVYPLRLHEDWLQPLNQYWSAGKTFWARLTAGQLEGICNFYFSPLILKGVLALVPLLAFAAVRAIRWVLAPRWPARGRRAAWVSVGAFFAWVALSAAWSPTPGIAREAAIWAVIFGLALFALLRRGLSPGEAGCLARLMVAMGAVVMLVAFLQSVPVFGDKIFLFMFKFSDLRNRFGSLLGHNTAAASYLMMTLFPCFSLLLASRKPWMRAAYGVYLGAALFAILVEQSRAVWGLVPVLGFLAVRSALRGAGAQRRVRWIPAALLGVLALGLLTQAIDRPWNKLYVRDNPLGRRLKAVSLTGLKGEARLRLNVISATLVSRHPLTGHGLYAFQYVYPRRQAEYFAEHPDSRLNQTLMRPNMAHNEYMQVSVDQGLIGLGLLLWLLGEIAVRGRRRRRELEGAPRLLHEGLGWSALAFALHSGFDFPFHIPQLAVPGVLCLVAWGTFRRGGQAAMEPEALSLLASPPVSPASVSSSTFRPLVFARLLAVFLLALLVPLGSYPLIKCLQGDFFFLRGNAYGDYFTHLMQQTQQQKDRTIGQSEALLQAIEHDSRQLDPALRSLCARQAREVLNGLKNAYEVTPELKTQMLDLTVKMNRALVRARAQAAPALAATTEMLGLLLAPTPLPAKTLLRQSSEFVQAIERDPHLTPKVRRECAQPARQVLSALAKTEVSPALHDWLLNQVILIACNQAPDQAATEPLLAAGIGVVVNLASFNEFPLSNQVATLNQAIKDYRAALGLAPYNELIRMELAMTDLRMGRVFADAARSAGGGPADREFAAKAADRAKSFLHSGLDALEEARKGIDFHGVYWTRAQLYRFLAEVDPASDAKACYAYNVKQAVFYAPHGADFIRAWLDLAEVATPRDPVLIRNLQTRLYHLDAGQFHFTYFIQAMQSITDQRYALAASQLEHLLTIDPHNSLWLNHAARAQLLAGNRARAVALIKTALYEDPLSLLSEGGALAMVSLQHGWLTMLRYLKMVPPSANPWNLAEFRAMELEVRQRVGKLAEKPVYERPAGVDERQWQLMLAETRPGVLLHYFDDPARARRALDERLAMPGPPPLQRFWVESYYIASTVKDQALMARCREMIRTLDPKAPVLADLAPGEKKAPAKQ